MIILRHLAGAALVIGLLGSAACAREPAPLTATQRQAIASEIERTVRDAYDLSRPGVEQRMLSLYPDTGSIVSASAGQVVTSRDTLADNIRYFWEHVGVNMQHPKWIWDRMIVDVMAPNAAVMTATYHIPHINPHGQPHVIGGAWTAAFERRGGRWVIVQEHLSDLPTAIAMSMADTAVQGMAGMQMDSTARRQQP